MSKDQGPTTREVPVSSGAGSLMAGASSSCFSRRMSAVAYRWSSHATSGSSGRKTPSRRPSTTSVNRELAGPVASTRRDPYSCFCRL